MGSFNILINGLCDFCRENTASHLIVNLANNPAENNYLKICPYCFLDKPLVSCIPHGFHRLLVTEIVEPEISLNPQIPKATGGRITIHAKIAKTVETGADVKIVPFIDVIVCAFGFYLLTRNRDQFKNFIAALSFYQENGYQIVPTVFYHNYAPPGDPDEICFNIRLQDHLLLQQAIKYAS